MTDQASALLELLRDDDLASVALVKEQLVQGGIKALPELRALLARADSVTAGPIREVLQEIERCHTDGLFLQCCQTLKHDGDLEEAAWRLAATFLPGETFERQRKLLDEWGAEVGRRLLKAHSEEERIETLVEFLGHELRFRGNTDDYYNVNNSLLPEVIETRVGIPISLSLIYMLVGRRAGLPVYGVGLPGHFIIRHRGDFFDPFHGGRRMGLDECRNLVDQTGDTLTAAHLDPAAAPVILLRILTNLYALAAPSDPELAEKIGRWQQALIHAECGDGDSFTNGLLGENPGRESD